MINIEEKIKLAKEVGMDTWAYENSVGLEMKKHADDLTRLKIRPTTLEKIRELICPEVYVNIYGLDKYSLTKPIWWKYYGLFGPIWIKGRLPLESSALENWKENIPYGALLAVKEAKSLGLTNFQIHYPVTLARQRLKEDPVITGILGRKEKRVWYSSTRECPPLHSAKIGRHSHMETIVPGQLMEVFSWDDGKIYD